MIRVLVILTIEGLITPLMGAVIYNAEPKTIVGLTANNTIAFDFDRNGVEDLRVEAVYLGFSTPVVQFLSPSTTQLLYEWSEPAMYGVDFLPYRSSQLIGPHSETTVVRFVSPDSGAGTRRLTKGFPLPDPREAERNFLNQTAYLGFRFQGEEGLHYGYALFTDTTSRGTTLVATAWESEPDTAIVAGAVPEPSTTLLLSLAGGSFLFWRRRAN
jgi:hypothetical protein